MKKYVKTPTVYQMEAAECGAASLAMVFSFFGKRFSLEQMRAETGVSRDGCNAGNLLRVAGKYGLECHGYKKSMEGLKSLQPPCILHWENNHFVVFEGVKGRYAYINDPAFGRRKLTKEELKSGYSGVVLTFRKTDAFRKTERPHSLCGVAENRVLKQLDAMAELLLVGVLLIFPGVASIMLLQQFVDMVMARGDLSDIRGILFAMAALLIVYLLLWLGKELLQERIQKRTMVLSLRTLLDKLLCLPISFFEQRYAGDLSARIENHATVSRYLVNGMTENIQMVLHSVFYLGVLFIYSPTLGTIALLSVFLATLFLKWYADEASALAIQVQQELGKLAGMVGAGVRLRTTLKISGAEDDYKKKLLVQEEKVKQKEQKLYRSRNVVYVVTALLKWGTTGVLLVVGAGQIENNELSYGILMASLLLYLVLFKPFRQIANRLDEIQKVRADILREEDIYEYPQDKKFDLQKKRRKITEKLDGRVELRGVSFGYSSLKEPVVAEINFRVDCGLRYALVGPSGAGKSTIMNIISGLYAPKEGVVLFDGVETERIPREVRNASISIVHSDGVFFAGTIRENLTMWNPNISEAELVRAAKDACIHEEIVNKPGAYEFLLTEYAHNMSGGQRQRLEIARALATNPSILILDEATSALDPIVEKSIMDNIKRRGCTCLVTAQRLSTIRDCDRILVLDNGRIVQKGTHEELMIQGGTYHTLMNGR